MCEEIVAQEYVNLELLPYGETIKITKLGIFNYDTISDEDVGRLRYKFFRKLDPENYPEGKDPKLDYVDEDHVTPVIVHSDSKKYKVKPLLWVPLRDVIVKIMQKQMRLGKKLLPIEVFIDDKDQFMVKLFNL